MRIKDALTSEQRKALHEMARKVERSKRSTR
jgi:hypothetical protein